MCRCRCGRKCRCKCRCKYNVGGSERVGVGKCVSVGGVGDVRSRYS
jgi:hypothetical protein